MHRVALESVNSGTCRASRAGFKIKLVLILYSSVSLLWRNLLRKHCFPSVIVDNIRWQEIASFNGQLYPNSILLSLC